MSTVRTDDKNYKAIADAIREKKRTEGLYRPEEMPEVIKTLGGQEKELLENTLTVLDRDDIESVKQRTFFGSIIEEVNLPNCTSIGENAFYECHKLKKISLPQVTSIPAGTFYLPVSINDEDNLSEVYLDSCVSIADEAFKPSHSSHKRSFLLYAPVLEEVWERALSNAELRVVEKASDTWGENITYLGEGAFQNTSIQDHEGNTIEKIIVNVEDVSKYYVFNGCKVGSIHLPKGKGRIGTQYFQSATSTREIDIGGDITNINANAFKSCYAMKKLILRGATVPEITTTTFTGSSIALQTGYVYVPDELVESYKTATNWSTYADQIKPLSELDAEATTEETT